MNFMAIGTIQFHLLGNHFVTIISDQILTTVATLKLQRRNVLEYLVTALQASIEHRSAPSLLPS
jgi:hypothetical protein